MPPKQPRVLMIDDNRDGMIARRAHLEEKGFAVSTAVSGSSGLKACDEERFDVVVTDYRMPKMGGLQVLREVRKRYPKMPVVILSGCVKRLGLEEELAEVADAVLLKGPGELDDLARTVSRLVRRRPQSEQTSASRRHRAPRRKVGEA